MSANIDFETGRVLRLDRVPEARTPLTESDVTNSSTLMRILDGLIRDFAKLLGLWRPRRLDFEGVPLDDTGTLKFRLEHKFGGAVRYWIVSWDGTSAHNLRAHADTTDDMLIVTSTSTGTATVRVEEAG